MNIADEIAKMAGEIEDNSSKKELPPKIPVDAVKRLLESEEYATEEEKELLRKSLEEKDPEKLMFLFKEAMATNILGLATRFVELSEGVEDGVEPPAELMKIGEIMRSRIFDTLKGGLHSDNGFTGLTVVARALLKIPATEDNSLDDKSMRIAVCLLGSVYNAAEHATMAKQGGIPLDALLDALKHQLKPEEG